LVIVSKSEKQVHHDAISHTKLAIKVIKKDSNNNHYRLIKVVVNIN